MILKLIHLLKRKANMKCCTVFNWNGRWNLFLVGFVKDGRLHDPINLPMSFFWYTDQTIKVYGCRTTEPLLFWSFNHIKYKFIKLQESISIFGIISNYHWIVSQGKFGFSWSLLWVFCTFFWGLTEDSLIHMTKWQIEAFVAPQRLFFVQTIPISPVRCQIWNGSHNGLGTMAAAVFSGTPDLLAITGRSNYHVTIWQQLLFV